MQSKNSKEIYDNYNRGSKILVMSPPTISTVNKTEINSTTIKKILKPQLYKRVIIQQSKTKNGQSQKKRKSYRNTLMKNIL